MRVVRRVRLIQWGRLFTLSAGVVLLLTAAAKFFSGAADIRLLQTADPILAVPYRYALPAVGMLEEATAMVCLVGQRVWIQAATVAWLSSAFMAYRLALLWVGYQKPCGCLGGLADAIGMSGTSADHLVKGVLAYLLFGSYAVLVSLWLRGRRRGRSSLRGEIDRPSPAYEK
jgi:hypothetical protein